VHQQTRNGDRHLYAIRTRFIPEALLPHFEPSFWPKVSATGPARPTRPTVRIDVGARMRGMWR